MPIQSRLLAESALDIELIAHPIYDRLSAEALVRLSSTCRTAHASVQAYYRIAFNIDRLLSRFFPTPTPSCSATCAHDHAHTEEHARARAFRSLQAATGTLVSGSAALQFFDRKLWPESDLDLYAYARHRREVGRWLLAEGYRYKPTSFQDPRFEVEVAQCIAKRPNGIYSMPGVLAIFTFVKPLPQPPVPVIPPPRRRGTPVEGVISATESDFSDAENEEGRQPKELKVQIIVAKHSPMENIEPSRTAHLRRTLSESGGTRDDMGASIFSDGAFSDVPADISSLSSARHSSCILDDYDSNVKCDGASEIPQVSSPTCQHLLTAPSPDAAGRRSYLLLPQPGPRLRPAR